MKKRAKMHMEINGAVVEMFTIGVLASLVRRLPATIRKWEEDGVLPPTPYTRERVNGRPVRLYTKDMIEAVVSVIEQTSGEVRADRKSAVTNKVVERWKALGVQVG